MLLRESGRVLHAADPGSKVIVGGLFGRPLQVPPNTPPGAFLSGLYRQRPIKKFFDGVALHPYVADAGAMRAMILNLRRVMKVHHDGRDAALRDRARLGIRQLRVALGARPPGPGA